MYGGGGGGGGGMGEVTEFSPFSPSSQIPKHIVNIDRVSFAVLLPATKKRIMLKKLICFVTVGQCER